MTTKLASVSSLQKGSYMVIDNEACKITDIQISKTGKHGHAKARIVAVGVLDGKKRDMMTPCHDNVEVPIVDKKSAQVLSISGNKANVMDAETYETFDLEIPEDLKPDCVEGCSVLYWEIMGKRVMKQIKSE